MDTCVCMSYVPLLFTWHHHNTVNWPCVHLCSVTHSCLTLSATPCNLPGSSLQGIFLSPRDLPDKNTGVGYHFLLQGSSRPKDQTHVSSTGRRFFTAAAEPLPSCPTLCDPRDGSPPGPLSLGSPISPVKKIKSLGETSGHIVWNLKI